jgi:O-antigen/teichoic acid export membrane protein
MPAFLTATVATAFFPTLSAQSVRDSDDFAATANRALWFVFIVALPAAVGIALVADDFMSFLYGDEFSQSVILIRMLAIHVPLVSINMILGTVIVAVDRQRQWLVISIVAAIINPVLNLVAIPATARWFGNGAIGAAFVTVLTEAIPTVGCLILRPSGVLDRATARVMGRIVVAGSAMIPVVMFLGARPLWLQILGGIVAYITASALLRTVTPSDLRVFRDAVLGRLTSRRAHQGVMSTPSLEDVS